MKILRKIILSLLAVFVFAQSAWIGTGYADGNWHSDYRYWSQNQTQYVGQAMQYSGCCVVAQAKMLYGMGIETSPSFNPSRMITCFSFEAPRRTSLHPHTPSLYVIQYVFLPYSVTHCTGTIKTSCCSSAIIRTCAVNPERNSGMSSLIFTSVT